ncbi:unnamed protein product [Onchocerca flexuosa]|uniref:Uncharacterized protein n=1 Tax=Onchocerca flexuosa TaxID=387005 RepID=A0A183HGB3_9BILA|nr:unnamed protein product [Onchocerca flexuosa]
MSKCSKGGRNFVVDEVWLLKMINNVVIDKNDQWRIKLFNDIISEISEHVKCENLPCKPIFTLESTKTLDEEGIFNHFKIMK